MMIVTIDSGCHLSVSINKVTGDDHGNPDSIVVLYLIF